MPKHTGLMAILVAGGLSLPCVQPDPCGAQDPSELLITLQAEQLPLRDVLKAISEQAGVNFIYEDNLVADVYVTLQFERLTVGRALEAVLDRTALIHRRVSDTHIVLMRKSQGNLLSGRVVDRDTGEPLLSASVFLANTTIGTMTDANGGYRLKNAPSGAYTLVISYIGYEMQTFPVQLTGADSLERHISLKPRTLEFRDLVEVIAERDGIGTPKTLGPWQREFNAFKDLFLGVSPYGKACRLINPDVIHFYYDEKDYVFEAYADKAIQVENMALGYRLFIILESFRSASNAIKYKIYPRFEELQPKTIGDRKRWDKNRQAVYQGSLKHFLSALARDKLGDEQFAVMQTRALSHRIKVSEYGGLQREFGATDSEPDMIVGRFKPGDIVSQEPSGLLRVQFNGYLLIRHGIESYASIKLNAPYALIDVLGNVHTPGAFTKYGVWWEERIGDLLPEDYTLY